MEAEGLSLAQGGKKSMELNFRKNTFSGKRIE